MTLLATPALVRFKVSEVLRVRRDRPVHVVALAATPSWTYSERVDLPGGRHAVVRPCVSTLAIRDELSRLDDLPDDDVLVLLTDQPDTELGASITARLAGEKVLPLDRWQQVTSLFRARGIDPSLVDEQWAVEALIAGAPAGGYPAVPSGFLDRETALAVLAHTAAGLDRLDLDLTGLLQWSLDPEHVERWCRLDPAVRDGLSRWLVRRGGDGRAVDAVLRCLSGDYREDAVAVGIVLAALAGEDVRAEAQVPRTMLETRVVGAALSVDVAQVWGRAAESLMQRALAVPHRADIAAVLPRAETLLAEVGAKDLAAASNVLESGLVERLRELAAATGRVVRARTSKPADLLEVEQLHRRVESHLLATGSERVRRAAMSVRLLRWLVRQRTSALSPASDLTKAARRQETEDAWVDVARARVWEGDVDPGVAATYRALCTEVHRLRAEHEQQFARLLADHTRTGSTLPGVLPVENVLDDVVAPLAAAQRVLLVVLDGMSTGVARELLTDLTSRPWVEHALQPARPVLAVLPSVTRVSRTSLLTGRLLDGGQADERAAFADRGWPLFHKADLTGTGAGEALSPKVTSAVHGRSRVVGVVVNTVDDTLDKGGRTPWTAESVDRLLELLTVAAEADRVVVLTSDHGHVHERGSRLQSDTSGGARYRLSEQPAGQDEVELSGSRVLLGGGRVVAAWNETVRYTASRNGYHGGASAQEVVIPLALLARTPLDLDGWVPRHHPEPDWWVESAPPAVPERPVVPVPRRRRAAVPAPESAALFDAPQAAPVSWVDKVLASKLVSEQLARHRRGAMPADRLALLLRTLDERGGTATVEAVARALDVPTGRVGSQVTAAQRVLNVDGYPVLVIEAETVKLNTHLLRTQVGVAS